MTSDGHLGSWNDTPTRAAIVDLVAGWPVETDSRMLGVGVDLVDAHANSGSHSSGGPLFRPDR